MHVIYFEFARSESREVVFVGYFLSTFDRTHIYFHIVLFINSVLEFVNKAVFIRIKNETNLIYLPIFNEWWVTFILQWKNVLFLFQQTWKHFYLSIDFCYIKKRYFKSNSRKMTCFLTHFWGVESSNKVQR